MISDNTTFPPIVLGGSPDNAIEVVSKRDLYTFEDIPQGNPPQMGEPQIMGGAGEIPYIQNPMFQGGIGSQQPNPIQFQPVINVIGGDNKGSIEVPTAAPIQNPMMNGGGAMPQIATIMGGGSLQKEESNGGGENLSFSKPIDFTNLVIKKQGE